MHTIVQNFVDQPPNMLPQPMGYKKDSILNTTEGLPMHDLLGVLQYEAKELIKHLISEHLISLQDINDAIISFPYGYADVVNKPYWLLKLHSLQLIINLSKLVK